MIERVYYRVKLDANTFIYTPYLSNIPTSITDIPTNVTYDTTDGITLKTKETWTYDNNESSSVTAEREIPLKAGEGVTMDVSEDGKYVVIKVDPKRETHIGTSVPTDDYPDLFVNTTDDSLSYKAPDGSWKPIAGGGLVNDVLINGVSIVVDKTANIPVDLGTDADSSNPIANKVVVKALNGLSTDITNHKNNKQNPHSVTAAQVGLGAVNNTSDADKPVSTKQAAAIKVVQDDVTAHKNNIKNPHMVTAAQVGLGNVNNTSDANKPVSTAQQAALDKKIDKAGGTFSGNVAIQGDLTVSGTTTTESETQLAVKENVIVTNADKANLQTLLSGLAINKNSTATYGIMYDPADDTVKFGEGTLDANRKFVFKAGEGHPLAIRADSSQFTDAVLVKWNATTKAFEPAGGTWQDLLNKIEITDIDLTLGDETVLYDTTNGIQLSATGKITRKDGTSEQPQVDLDIPVIPGNGITIEKAANKEQIVVKVNTSVVALKSDLTSYAKTSDLASYVKTATLNTTLESYVKTADLAPYAKTVDVVAKSQVGVASGVASLGADGKVPAAQLPTIDNYSKFSEVKLQNSNIVPTYSATTGITVTSTGSMKHANNVVDTPTNTMVVPITAGKNMGATKSGNLVVFTANDQVGVGATLPAGSSSQKIFIKTDENYEGGGSSGGGSGANVQADYNQNDSTAADYIKNRPFYKETAIGDTLLDTTFTTTLDGSDNLWSSSTLVPTFTEGDNVIVVFNGVSYNETVKLAAGALICVGNLALTNMGEDTGEPFIVLGIDMSTFGIGTTIATKEAQTNATIKINKLQVNIKKIDPQFVQDLPIVKNFVINADDIEYTEQSNTAAISNTTYTNLRLFLGTTVPIKNIISAVAIIYSGSNTDTYSRIRKSCNLTVSDDRFEALITFLFGTNLCYINKTGDFSANFVNVAKQIKTENGSITIRVMFTS